MKPSDLYTQANSENGAQMPIKFPNGDLTGKHIIVRGTDSEGFNRAAAIKNRERVEILGLPEEKQGPALAEASRRLLASCVAGWDLDGECTPEAVCALFKNAPDVMKQVDDFAVRRANFFTPPPVS